jgi:hypothetical protein
VAEPLLGWPSFWVTLLGSSALLAVGVWVASVRPRRLVQWLLAGYCAGLGLVGVVDAVNRFGASQAVGLVGYWLLVAAAGSLTALAVAMFRGSRAALAWACSLAVPVATCALGLYLVVQLRSPPPTGSPADVPFARTIGVIAIFFAELFFLVAASVAFRVAARAGQLASARQLAWVSAGLAAQPLVIWIGFPGTAAMFLSFGEELQAAFALVLSASAPCVAIAWTLASRGLEPPASRWARNVVLSFVTIAVVALAFDAFTDGTPTFLGLNGLTRLLGALALAYVVLRHNLFDLDVKVKWTLSRGTVAAVFLAVFFVVAQLAQNFLSERYGWALGGAAAGLLLFAIAPIQRAAERLSDKAMPGVRPENPAYVLRRKRETYRNAYATAWADGTMTPKDVRMLHQVREALGLPEKDILAIEREWTRKEGSTEMS